MDKKYTVMGVLFLVAGVIMWWMQNQQLQKQQAMYAQSIPAETVSVEEADSSVDEGSSQSPVLPLETTLEPALLSTATESLSVTMDDSSVVDEPVVKIEEKTFVLENDLIRVVFTNLGGAIKEVSMKDYKAVQGEDAPYVFNQIHDVPALAISREKDGGDLSEYAPEYKMLSHTADSIQFVRQEANGLWIKRSYSLTLGVTEGATPYLIEHSTQFENKSELNQSLNRIYVNLGTAAPEAADNMGMNLNAGWYNGEDYDYVRSSKFSSSKGIMGLGAHDAIPFKYETDAVYWGAIKNQFFAAILTPEKPGAGLFMKAVDFPADFNQTKAQRGITAAIAFDIPVLGAGDIETLDMDYYVGPKEYPRLEHMNQSQDLIMQFGIFGFFSKLLLHFLDVIKSIVQNWGVAIILVTILIRLLFWPLTAKAAESSKKMAKIQGPMKAIKEKYKDNPQRIQKETMKLFQKHKINPLAGCLPLFIQIPIFLSFYYMLRSSSELRFAHFLWIQDLSLPDTVAHIANFPLNILPLFMGVSMFYQMRMTPTPSTDESAVKIMRFMPVMMLVFCYNFSSGLVLYWTVSNLMSITQQIIINRRREVDLENGNTLEAEVVKTKKKKRN